MLNMRLGKNILLILFIGLFAAACTTKPETTTDTGPTSTEDAEAAARAEAARLRALADAQEAQRRAQEERERLLAANVIFFELDQDLIKPEYQEMLRLHGERLSSNPGARVTLEGHADERGTPEYNLALGERRAKAVASILRTFGASNSQINTISFGEESPANPAHNESAWAENRRVVFKYQGL